MGGYEHNPIPWGLEEIPRDFTKKLLKSNFEHFEPLSRLAMRRVPSLGKAEIITLFVHHLLGIRPDRNGVTLRPRLLHGVDQMNASLAVRGQRVGLTVRRAATLEDRGGRLGAERLPWSEEGVRIPLPASDIAIEIHC